MKLQDADCRLAYTLADQERMARAKNYFAWQARLVLPHLGRRVVEVGCGVGNFTQKLLDRELVIAVDSEAACVDCVRQRFAPRRNLRTEVADAGSDLANLARFAPDSCVCLNVLEHVQDDLKALRGMAAVLPPGGAVVLIVPAFPALYGPIDRNLHHCRRYVRGSLAGIARAAGLGVVVSHYMNLPGFFGWWFNARVLKRQAQSATQIEIFDRSIVPIASRLEGIVHPPFGQSIFCVLRKTEAFV